jgi:alpha-glucosidase (family GH31 glycosyl hydrolase)
MYDSEMYDYAAAHNYLVLDRTGKPYDLPMFSFSAVMLDLTNPHAGNG